MEEEDSDVVGIDSLPPECHLTILEFVMDARSIIQMSQVNWYWHELVQDDGLWEVLYEETFGGGHERRNEKEAMHLKHQVFGNSTPQQQPKDSSKKEEEGPSSFVWDWKIETLKNLKAIATLRTLQDKITWCCMNGCSKFLENSLLQHQGPLSKKQKQMLTSKTKRLGRTPLHLAAAAGRVRLVKYLIAHGCDVNVKDVGGDTPAMQALRNGKLDVLMLLGQEGGDTVWADIMSPKLFENALHVASSVGRHDAYDIILGEYRQALPMKDYVQLQTSGGETMLTLAAMNGHVDTVKYLIEQLGADPNSGARPALDSAVMNLHKGVVAYLLSLNKEAAPGSTNATASSNGDNPERVKINRIGGDSAVHYVAGVSAALLSTRRLKYFLEENKEYRRRGTKRKTIDLDKLPDIRLEVLDALLEAGADINAPSPAKGTPFYHALSIRQDMSLLKALVDRGADINYCHPMSSDYRYMLSPVYAAVYTCSRTMLEKLKEKGVDFANFTLVNDQFAISGVTQAIIGNRHDVAQWMLDHPTFDSTKHFVPGSSFCASPLVLAAGCRKPEIISYLISQCGESVNGRTEWSRSFQGEAVVDLYSYPGITSLPLNNAVACKDLEAVALLVAKGASINARDSSGRTPLHVACQQSEPSVLGYLLDRGADVKAQYQGNSPLHVLLNKPYFTTTNLCTCIRLLTSHGADITEQHPSTGQTVRSRIEGHSILLAHIKKSEPRLRSKFKF